MLLSIVTLNYNKSHLTVACLASLHTQFANELADNEIEVIVVDNASPDGSAQSLREEIKKQNYKNVHLIANTENAGFGKGCNLGAKSAKGDFILFLNNDTIVKDTGILSMAKYMQEHTEVSVLGGQLSNLDGSKQPSVGSFYTPVKVFLLLLGLQRYGIVDKNPDTISRVDWVKGGLLMIRKNAFALLCGFDENIFMYTEDMELCYRAKLKGLGVYFYPDVHVLHQETGSSNRTFAIVNIYQNLLYFYKKHRSKQEYLLIKSLLLTKAVALIGVGKIMRKPYYIQTYEKALKVT
jgi:N-acetylglucosaminyl-diphospho-decaprenol L-rhamnosyltransferase